MWSMRQLRGPVNRRDEDDDTMTCPAKVGFLHAGSLFDEIGGRPR
jgi:hypothetical protein